MSIKDTARRPDVLLAASVRKNASPVKQGPHHAPQRLQTLLGNRAVQQLVQEQASQDEQIASRGVSHVLGSGVPLPAPVRAEAETRFNADFSQVRVHDHAAAHALAQRHLARALTVGTDIVFNEGRYQPGSNEGRRLLAHELAHVVQQSRGAGTAPGPAHEAAADAAARAVAAGSGPVSTGPAAARGIQREPLSAEEIAKLTLPQLQARIAENEHEFGLFPYGEEYKKKLEAEHILLQARYLELSRAPAKTAQSQATVPAVDPEITAVMLQISAELAEVAPLVTKLSVDVPLNPKDHALNTVKGVATRLALDQKFTADFVPLSGPLSKDASAAAARFEALQKSLAPVVAVAEKWHADNPAGKSLGMWNEEKGTWLAGKGIEHWEKGGWYYLSGGAAFAGAFGIAFLEAGEQQITFGFHDTATAVSQAYTRGDISWNEGEQILLSAGGRALLTAAILRGAGVVTSRVGKLAATGLKLAPQGLAYGAVAGGVSGGLSGTVSLGTQSVITVSLQDLFSSPAAKALWARGLPSGRQWAIAIPISVLLGGLYGMRAVQISNKNLIGSIVDTPGGPSRIIAITTKGQVVLEPVAGPKTSVPSPPPSEIVLVYDAATQSWGAPKGASTQLATVPQTGRATVPAGGKLLSPTEAPLRIGSVPKYALPPVQPAAKQLPPPATTITEKPAVPKEELKPAEKGLAALPPAKTPSTPRTQAAARRVAETQDALTAAGKQASGARARVLAAQGDLQAARDLAAEAGGSAEGGRLVREAEQALRREQAELQTLERSELRARSEAAAASRGQQEVVRLEAEIADLDAQIAAELNPPGGFTRGQIFEGRRAGIAPLAETRLQPSGAKYHELVARRNAALRRLESETEGLTRSLAEQVAAATPGRTARPVALNNAAALDPVLHPVSGVPIDVTTGLPVKTTEWAVDHLMSRSEIARDPRFARLTPLQRDALLLEVPENYLPMTTEANSSKGGLSVDQWIAARASSGQPLPPHVIKALRAADARARATVEAKFKEYLPQ